MGNWAIVIHGVGCHHNVGLPTDADRMTAEFVTKLQAAGHAIHSASITYGGEHAFNVSAAQPTETPAEYIAGKEAQDKERK